MPKNCKSDSWIVEEVVEENEDGTTAVLRISQNTSYEPGQKWPEPGQQLVVKEPE